MTATDIASSNLFWPGAVPLRLISHTESSTGKTLVSAPAAWGAGGQIILGMDATAWGTSPDQCFAQFYVPTSTSVWYDSQSIGEGLGIRFTWRGQIPIGTSETVSFYFNAASATNWAVSVWGLLTPHPVNLDTL